MNQLTHLSHLLLHCVSPPPSDRGEVQHLLDVAVHYQHILEVVVAELEGQAHLIHADADPQCLSSLNLTQP